MASTFFGLNIATSGISAAQAGLSTTMHNVANENTKGIQDSRFRSQQLMP